MPKVKSNSFSNILPKIGNAYHNLSFFHNFLLFKVLSAFWRAGPFPRKFLPVKGNFSCYRKFLSLIGNFVLEILSFEITFVLWKEFSSCDRKSFPVSANFFLWQEATSCDRKFLSVKEHFFLLYEILPSSASTSTSTPT